MKESLRRKIIKLVVILLMWGEVSYSFDEMGFSAEAQGVGENVIAETDKVYLMFYNPAGIRSVVVPEIFFDYNILYQGLTDGSVFVNNTVGYVSHYKKNSFGIGFNQFGLKDWYLKDTVVLSYARDIKSIIPKFVFGTKIQLINENYFLDDYMKRNPVFEKGSSKSLFDVSVGLQYIRDSSIVWGLTIENINQPDEGYYTSENVPIIVKLGYKNQMNKFKFLSALEYDTSQTNNYVGMAGTYDFLIFKIVKFVPAVAVNFGHNNYFFVYTGFSLNTKRFGFSYSAAIDPSAKISLFASHRISIGYKFFSVPLEEQQVLKTDYDTLAKERAELVKQIDELKKQIEELNKQREVVQEKRKPEEKVVSPMKKEKGIPTKEQEYPEISPIAPATTVSEENVVQPQPTVEEKLLEKLKLLEDRLKEIEKPTKIQKEEKKPTETKPSAVVSEPKPQPQKPKKRTHTVVQGDTLPKLAEKYYGDAKKWKIIYDANKDKTVRGQILPGTVLEIPNEE